MITKEHSSRIMLMSDMLAYLSKVDIDRLSDEHPKEIVDQFFKDREDSAIKEMNEGDNSLEGLKVIK